MSLIYTNARSCLTIAVNLNPERPPFRYGPAPPNDVQPGEFEFE